MDFDRSRMLELSGLPLDDSDSDVLTESFDFEEDHDDNISEDKIRKFVRKELQKMMEEMNNDDPKDTFWIHASTGGAPKSSRKGLVGMGFLGPGFKR